MPRQDFGNSTHEASKGIALILGVVSEEGDISRPLVGFHNKQPMEIVDVEVRFSLAVPFSRNVFIKRWSFAVSTCFQYQAA